MQQMIKKTNSVMRISWFLFSLLIIIPMIPGPASAIINAEDLDLAIDEDGIAGKLGLSVNGSAGNSDKISEAMSGRVVWRHGQHMEMLVGSFSFGKSRGVRNTNKAFVHLRHRDALNKTWSLESFGQAQQDEFARIKLRTLLGGGLRWSYLSDYIDIHAGLGSFYEREALRAAANIPLVTHLWRVNSYLGLRYHLDDRVRMQNTVYYQPSWGDTADYRLLDDAALYVALNDSLDLKISVEISQDSRPPAGVKNINLNYKTSLSFRF